MWLTTDSAAKLTLSQLIQSFLPITNVQGFKLKGRETTKSNANMVNPRCQAVYKELTLAWLLQTKQLSYTTSLWTKHLLLFTSSVCSLFPRVSSVMGQTSNWTYSHQLRLMSQRQSEEQHRQQEARRLHKERQLEASLRSEESFERRKHLRQEQEERKRRETESALLKVCFLLWR